MALSDENGGVGNNFGGDDRGYESHVSDSVKLKGFLYF